MYSMRLMAPQIADPTFIPNYRDHLPMGVEVDLIVHLKRYSRDLIENTFMKIEEPEVSINIPVKSLVFVPAVQKMLGR